MGPRLDSRGRLSRKALTTDCASLQWGRGWTAAEGVPDEIIGGDTQQLQWGRGWTAAEGAPQGAGWRAETLASMGPRLDSRGRRPPSPASRPKYSLQWGRGWTAAEGSCPQALVRPCSRFNGAAAGQPRKGGTIGSPKACWGGLQWGRGWTAAEGDEERVGLWLDPRASMGPRLDSRGRWSPGPRDSSHRTSFNGAAAGQPRKRKPKLIAVDW